ncbi:hypothetical protein ACFLQN_03980 [Candidatus Aenigmatarchaeota archaeon]
MRYINSLQGGLISFIIFLVLALTIHGNGPSEDITLILTISTFIFAILIGFFIARANSRFDEMRRTCAKEDAFFLSLYKTSQIIGGKFAKRIGDLIDEYYIVSYDSELTNYAYKEELPYFLKMWDEVIKLKIKTSVTYQRLLNTLTSIEEYRNVASTASKEKIGYGQWTVLIILSFVILFNLFFIKTSEIHSIIITVLLSTALVIILLILRDLQNLKFGGEKSLLAESGQEIFESIGKLRYYNEKFLKKGWYDIPNNVKQYRIGLHKSGEKINIKTVRNKKYRK